MVENNFIQMPQILYSLKAVERVILNEKPSQVIIVTSRSLFKKLNWAIKQLGIPRSHILTISDGESAKAWQEVEKLLKKFLKLKLDRKSIVIALGGGTVGDSVGFASSIYLRGIRYVQIPTTLLAQVDSAHGGKTGINFSNYKNQIGSFHQPIATVIDTRFIRSLSKEQIIEGLGEIIKAGYIKDPTILTLLKKETVSTFPKSKNLKRIIEKSIAVKQFYVKNDLKDNGQRQILNFGHTLGHAIELNHKIGHGRAVIIGMLQELAITEKLGLTPISVRKNLISLLKKLGVKVDASLKPRWNEIMHDKKINNNYLILPIITGVGKSGLYKISLDKIKKLIRL